MEPGLPDRVKKNILDLQYNKHLQHYNTAVIVLFTYFIGVAIAMITGQVSMENTLQMMALAVASILVISVVVVVMLNNKASMSSAINEIRQLREI